MYCIVLFVLQIVSQTYAWHGDHIDIVIIIDTGTICHWNLPLPTMVFLWL